MRKQSRSQQPTQMRPVILCVDDEEVVLASLRRELRLVAPGCKGIFAKSGVDALETLERLHESGRTVPLLISDQLMPGMLGDELLAICAEKYPKMMQIMLTGQASAESVGRALNNGRLFRFLSKPWLLEDLQLSVRAALQASFQERRLEEQSVALQRAYERSLAFVPGHYLELLGRERLEDVERGDAAAASVTVLFADIRGFTALTESLGPTESFRFINDYFMATEAAIRSNGGFIDHYQGDGTMALFPEHPEDAVKGAVGFSRAVDRFNAERLERGFEPIEVGVGLHTGDVIAGVSGGEFRLQCSVIGDCVNTAARIEGLSSRYASRLIISEDVERALEPGAYTCRKLETVRVKGKKTSLTTYEVLDALCPDVREQRLATLMWFEEGVAALDGGDTAAALGAFARVVAATPDDRAAQILLDQCHHRLRHGHTVGGTGAVELSEKRW